MSRLQKQSLQLQSDYVRDVLLMRPASRMKHRLARRLRKGDVFQNVLLDLVLVLVRLRDLLHDFTQLVDVHGGEKRPFIFVERREGLHLGREENQGV